MNNNTIYLYLSQTQRYLNHAEFIINYNIIN
jgi:hypothetical protein